MPPPENSGAYRRDAGVRVKVDEDLAEPTPGSARSSQVFNASASILSRPGMTRKNPRHR
jgi:hypothetical protein